MTVRLIVSYSLRCLALLVLLPGCHAILPLDSLPAGDDYECTTKVMNCRKTAQTVDPVVDRPVPSGGCYTAQAELTVGNTGYCDQRWKIQRIGYPPL